VHGAVRFLLVLVAADGVPAGVSASIGPSQSSPIAISEDGASLVAVNPNADSVSVFRGSSASDQLPDALIQDPSFHVFDAATGTIEWEDNMANAFPPTSVSGGAVFNGVGNIFPPELRVQEAGTGATLASFKADSAVNSGAAIVGKDLLSARTTRSTGRAARCSPTRCPEPVAWGSSGRRKDGLSAPRAIT